MSRAGRKRKSGARHPGGQTVKTKHDDKTRTSRQPHRRALAAELRTDERAESPLGRLFLRQRLMNERHPKTPVAPALHVDADLYDAGARFAFVVGEYASTIGAPRSTSGSGRGFDCLAEITGVITACKFDRDNCGCYRRKARYDGAFETLARVGRREMMAVNRVVVHREEPLQEELVYLVAGLRALAWHFGLTIRPRRAHYENAN